MLGFASMVANTDCAFHTDGATLALSAVRETDDHAVVDAAGRSIEVDALRLALSVELVPCVGARARLDLHDLIGVGRARAHDVPAVWPGVVLDVARLEVAPTRVGHVASKPGRYCDLRVTFAAEEGADAPTFSFRGHSMGGDSHLVETDTQRAIMLSLDAPLVIDEATPLAEVTLAFDVRAVVSRMDFERIDPTIDGLSAFADLVGHVALADCAPSAGPGRFDTDGGSGAPSP